MDLTIAEKPILRGRIDWEEWLRQWEQAVDARTCLSLLHSGFEADTDTSGEGDRIRFYLKVANNWLIDAGESDSQEKRLGRKAFHMLGDRLFKPDGIHGGHERLFVLPSRVVHALTVFFSPRASGEGAGLTNLGKIEPSHANGLARDFIVGLCQYILVGDPVIGSGFDQSTLQALREQKPWALRTLHALGDQQLLRVVLIGAWWEKLDKRCYDELKSLALQTQVGKPGEWRTAATVGEALLQNSSAAILLALYTKMEELRIMQ